MNHQLASDFYPGWSRITATPAVQQNVLHRLMERLGLAVNTHFSDPSAGAAPSDRAFFKLGETLLQRAREAGQPLTVVVFELHDLPELESVFGRKVARRVEIQALDTLQRVAGRKGVARRTGPTSFAVLLPRMLAAGALASIRCAFGPSCCMELEVGDEDIVLVPDFKVQTVREGFTVQAEYDSLRIEIAKAHERKQRHLQYLERERASHSKPMQLHPEWTATRPGDFARNVVSSDLHAPVPPTIPLPIGLR